MRNTHPGTRSMESGLAEAGGARPTRSVCSPFLRVPVRSAFSLTELLVVISIVILLVGLIVAGASQMMSGGKRSQTRMLLANLAGVATEYRAQTEQDVRYPPSGFTGNPYDTTDPRNDTNSIVEFNRTVYQNAPAAAEYYKGINQDQYVREYRDFDGDGEQGEAAILVDAWGTPIRYVGPDPGATPPTSANPAKGLPLKLQGSAGRPEALPYFASAGKDKLWGRINSQNEPARSGTGWDQNNDKQADAKDNLYSFQVN